jgi:hypothetical protein
MLDMAGAVVWCGCCAVQGAQGCQGLGGHDECVGAQLVIVGMGYDGQGVSKGR